MLNQLSTRQEIYRGFLYQMRAEADKSFVDAVITGSYDDDRLIALATILFELESRTHSGERVEQKEDLLWAIEVLDHADTLGWVFERQHR